MNTHSLVHSGDVGAVAYPTVCNLQEKVNIEALTKYSLARTDRRQSLLDAYLLRHHQHGERSGEFSTITVEYYKKPQYGRLLARGAAGQKLTREARAIAFGSHCGEADAPCCHPRLLKHKMTELGLWDKTKFPMLDRFVAHYKDWRSCIAEYCRIDMEDAKTEIIRIFYGGKPSVEIPFLIKLCDEVQQAAHLLLQQPTIGVEHTVL